MTPVRVALSDGGEGSHGVTANLLLRWDRVFGWAKTRGSSDLSILARLFLKRQGLLRRLGFRTRCHFLTSRFTVFLRPRTRLDFRVAVDRYRLRSFETRRGALESAAVGRENKQRFLSLSHSLPPHTTFFPPDGRLLFFSHGVYATTENT